MHKGWDVLKVKDITEELTQFDWSRTDSSSFKNNPKCGLYLLVFQNDFECSIHDRNVRKDSITRSGKVMIPARATTVKVGKFEKTLAKRMLDYNKHMHFQSTSNDVMPNLLSQCLQKAYVYPILCQSEFEEKVNGAQVYEKLWINAIDAYLKRNMLLTTEQNYRSEYRNTHPLHDEYPAIEKLLEDVSGTILELRDIVRLRLGEGSA